MVILERGVTRVLLAVNGRVHGVKRPLSMGDLGAERSVRGYECWGSGSFPLALALILILISSRRGQEEIPLRKRTPTERPRPLSAEPPSVKKMEQIDPVGVGLPCFRKGHVHGAELPAEVVAFG